MATVTSTKLIKLSSKSRASSVLRSTQASLMSLHTECRLLPYMSTHQGTSALSHWFKALCSTQHGGTNQINRLFFIECCSQGNSNQIKRHHCTQIQHWGTVSWSKGMCFNSYLYGVRICCVQFGLNGLSVDRECGKTLPSSGHYEKYSQFEHWVHTVKCITFSLTRDYCVAFIF